MIERKSEKKVSIYIIIIQSIKSAYSGPQLDIGLDIIIILKVIFYFRCDLHTIQRN